MPRVKGGYTTRRRRKAVLKMAKGYFGTKRTLYKVANQQVMKSLAYAYRDRKQNKRNFRKLWIVRINAACKLNGMKYSRFINGLNLAGVKVNRKMLADLAVNDPKAFAELVAVAQKGLAGENIVTPKASKAVKTVKEEAKVENKPEVKEEAKAPEKEVSNLADLKVAELRELAKTKGVQGYSTMKKAELIDALK